jgi:TRAP-type C4-dicarboxylate transport system permease small subunit
MLTSPALEFSLAWLYSAATAGGTLMALYALHAAANPAGPEHDIVDVRE